MYVLGTVCQWCQNHSLIVVLASLANIPSSLIVLLARRKLSFQRHEHWWRMSSISLTNRELVMHSWLMKDRVGIGHTVWQIGHWTTFRYVIHVLSCTALLCTLMIRLHLVRIESFLNCLENAKIMNIHSHLSTQLRVSVLERNWLQPHLYYSPVNYSCWFERHKKWGCHDGSVG